MISNLDNFLKLIEDLSISIELSKTHKECIVCLIENFNESDFYKISKTLKKEHDISLIISEEEISTIFYTDPFGIRIEFISPYSQFSESHEGCFVVDFTSY